MSGCAGWTGKGISPSRWSLCSPSPGSRARSWPDISPRRNLISRFRPLSAVPDSPKANINTTSVGRFPRPSRPNALRSATTNIASPGSSRVKSQSISRDRSRLESLLDSLRGIPLVCSCHPFLIVLILAVV